MKQLIVLVATVMLGIAIGGMVMGFSGQADQVRDQVSGNVEDIVTDYGATAGME
jgi:hypothetical protein